MLFYEKGLEHGWILVPSSILEPVLGAGGGGSQGMTMHLFLLEYVSQAVV